MIIHTRCSIGHAIVSNTRIAMRSIRKLPMYLASPITVTLHFSQSVDTAKVRDSSHLLIYLILPQAPTEENAVLCLPGHCQLQWLPLPLSVYPLLCVLIPAWRGSIRGVVVEIVPWCSSRGGRGPMGKARSPHTLSSISGLFFAWVMERAIC